jgi:prevent-host-death family protein
LLIDFVAENGYNIIKMLLPNETGGVVMNIRPSAAIRQNYNEIADLCRKTAEPVFLTKNGEGDMVVMDIETYSRREKMLKLREELLAAEEDRAAGRAGCTLDELESYLDGVIEGA